MARPDRYRRRGHWRAETRRPRRRDSSRCARDRRGRESRRSTRSRRVIPPARSRPSRLRALRPPPRHAAGLVGAAGAVPAQPVEPVAQIDVIAAEAALGQHGGDLGRHAAGAFAAGIEHHARQPRRQRQPVERLALGGDAAGTVDGAEIGEQRARLAERGRRRRVEKHQLAGSATPHWARSSTSEERSAARISGWP